MLTCQVRLRTAHQAADLIADFAKDFGLITLGTLNATWPRFLRNFRKAVRLTLMHHPRPSPCCGYVFAAVGFLSVCDSRTL